MLISGGMRERLRCVTKKGRHPGGDAALEGNDDERNELHTEGERILRIGIGVRGLGADGLHVFQPRDDALEGFTRVQGFENVRRVIGRAQSGLAGVRVRDLDGAARFDGLGHLFAPLFAQLFQYTRSRPFVKRNPITF